MRRDIKLDLINFVKERCRVCPRPTEWEKLYHLIPGIKRVGTRWEPPLPLILAAWSETSDIEKRDRLLLHINCASERGVIDRFDEYLRSLNEDQWVHEGEVNSS